METGPAKASPPEAASPTAFPDQKSENDDGDATSSRYSSCGESEFERYCSANSAMGTPSVCSSTLTVFNDLSEAEFGGSARSLGLGLGLGLGFGDEGGGLESFSLGGKAEGSCREETRRLSDESGVRGRESGANYGSSAFELYGGDDGLGFSSEGVDDGLMAWKVESSEALPLRGISGFGDGGDSDKGGGCGDDEEECSAFERVSDGGCNGLELDWGVANGSRVLADGEECGLDLVDGGEGRGSDGDVEEMEGCRDGGSSRDGHSEGEDSMYNYGMDVEDKKVEFSYCRNVDCPVEAKPRDENPLLMNSAVAFGSDDWDNFAQESGGIGLPSVSFSVNASKNQDEKSVEAQIGVLDSTPVNSIGFADTSQTEDTKVATDKPVAVIKVEGQDKADGIADSSAAQAGFPKTDESEEVDDVKDIPVASYQVHGGSDVIEFTKSTFTTPTFAKVQKLEKEDATHIPHTKDQVHGGDELADYSKNFSFDDIGLEPLDEEFDEKLGFYNGYDGTPQVRLNTSIEEAVNVSNSRISENQVLALWNSKIKFDSIYSPSANQPSSHSTVSSRNMKLNLLEDSKPKTEPSTLKKSPPFSVDHSGDHPAAVKTDVLGVNEFYDEVVHEMEEILLASNESPGARFSHSNRALQSHQSLPLRDGGSSASTSGTDDAYPFAHQPLRIDGIEVVGARQKKGDVSFGERLVGVKEYTVYKIRVWSGNDQWEVERRYRDFCTLYRRLKTLCASQGWVLPSPWATVEKESRKIFGNASPDVVSERSILIQESLRSILQPRFFTTSPTALIWFLSPQDSLPNSPASNTSVPQYNSLGNRENISTLGKTISLIVEIQPYKTVKQMLEAQHYTCAGCYKHFDDGKTLIRDFAQTFGWGKPRLCEYTGQLFCSSCHTNETAVLPARVLHNWDFTQYPVSQLAKSYLDSIHDQPMLCVSAVNPFLFSKVQPLLHVMGVRRKIGSILSYVHCSFRGSINRGLGSRRYLLESNDFFALRDLVDLSKGVFAVLPGMVETVLKKIVDHITEQCLVCCDVGVPCSARQACNDPSSLIFPFQEGDVEKCPSCESEFHKACFRKLTDCHCGAHLRVGDTMGLTHRLSSGALDFLGKGLGSSLSTGFLSGLFTKAKPETLGEHRDNDNVILMGSLPSTSL